MLVVTYYAPMRADGTPTLTQQKKLGTRAFGFSTLARALRYTPSGGYVETRYNEGGSDWAGGIIRK